MTNTELDALVADVTTQRLKDEYTHGNIMGRIAIALFGDQTNRTDEECVTKAAELGYGLTGARLRAEQAERERDMLRALLWEARDNWIKVGYGASHEDVAECRDLCDRIDALRREGK